jgi:hypothetical protein
MHTQQQSSDAVAAACCAGLVQGIYGYATRSARFSKSSGTVTHRCFAVARLKINSCREITSIDKSAGLDVILALSFCLPFIVIANRNARCGNPRNPIAQPQKLGQRPSSIFLQPTNVGIFYGNQP